MHRKIAKFSVITIAVLLVVAILLAIAAYWRLSQGPISLDFLREKIEATLNENIGNMRVSIGGVIIEQDEDSKHPRFRLRDLSLYNKQGQLMARTPRAAIIISRKSLLYGRLKPKDLELIGASLLIWRKADGSMKMGFGLSRDAEGGGTSAQVVTTTKSARADRDDDIGDLVPAGQINNMLDLVNGEMLTSEGGGVLATLDSIRITKASISLYDERNSVLWYAPRAGLVYQRMDYGYVVYADAEINSTGKPWRTEIVANYRTKEKRANISARIFDFIPSQMTKKVFAFTNFAKLDLPLNGHAEFEVARTGDLLAGSAELQVASGELSFPGYIADPIAVEEGLLRFDYEPESGDVIIGDSTIYNKASKAQLTGRIQGLRSKDGRLDALRVKLDAEQIAIESGGNGAPPLVIDKMVIQALAALNKPEVQIEKLTMQAGKAAVDLKATLKGGDGAMGITATGTAQEISAVLLKRLWPPAVAKGARRWIRQNVIAGRVTKAEYDLAIKPGDLARALAKKGPLPDDSVNLRFNVGDVSLRYFGDLPEITGADGSGKLSGRNFHLHLKDGMVNVPGGGKLAVEDGIMNSKNLGFPVVPTHFTIKAAGQAQSFISIVNMKPLELMHGSGIDSDAIKGDASINLDLDVPLSRKLNKEQVKVLAKATLKKAEFKNVADGVDLSGGDINFTINDVKAKASGTVRLNGQKAEMSWQRDLQGKPVDEVTVSATFDDAARQKLGIDVSQYLIGPVSLKLKTKLQDGKMGTGHITANLTKAAIRIDELSWQRPAGRKTIAELDIDLGNKKLTKIDNLKVQSKDFQLVGDLVINNKSGFQNANFSRVSLNKSNVFAVKLRKQPGLMKVTALGDSFDARPFLKDIFKDDKPSSKKNSGHSGSDDKLDIFLKFNRIIAYRGEIIRNAKGSIYVADGGLRHADMVGVFASGGPISMTMKSENQGARRLRVVGQDAGAALRAVNLYSKIAGGKLSFTGDLGPPKEPGIRKGKLKISNFVVRNETRLNEIDKKAAAKGKKNGPRNNQSLKFDKLTLPFSVDQQYIRIGDALVRGNELGASASGIIRKADGAMNIGGTIIPAYTLNAAIGKVPVIGDILTGGRGEGVFGLTFALKGTFKNPKFLINPMSAIAPGFLRQIFQIGGGGVEADGTATTAVPTSKKRKKQGSR